MLWCCRIQSVNWKASVSQLASNNLPLSRVVTLGSAWGLWVSVWKRQTDTTTYREKATVRLSSVLSFNTQTTRRSMWQRHTFSIFVNLSTVQRQTAKKYKICSCVVFPGNQSSTEVLFRASIERKILFSYLSNLTHITCNLESFFLASQGYIQFQSKSFLRVSKILVKLTKKTTLCQHRINPLWEMAFSRKPEAKAQTINYNHAEYKILRFRFKVTKNVAIRIFHLIPVKYC